MTSDGHELDELTDSDDDPFAGWWVGADDNWHPPDEPFTSGSQKPHRIRRAVVAILAVVIVLATTLSVLVGGGPLSSSSPTGPSDAQLTSEVRQIVSGSQTGGLQRAVTDVRCHPPGSWRAGAGFRCDVFGTAQAEIGQYVGTVQATTTAGEWRWTGTFKPDHPSTLT